MMRNHKFIAVLTAFFLIAEQLTLPPQNVHAAEIYSTPRSVISSPQPFEIPAELGSIDETLPGVSGKSLIYIQDAHDSLEAQENIAKIIHHLVDRYGIKTVFEEGYEGPVPSDTFFDMADSELKRKVSYFFLDHLRLGGAEYAHINRTQNFELIGAENRGLYLDCLKQYEKAHRASQLIQQDLKTVSRQLSVLESRFYPAVFHEWFKKQQVFMHGELSFADFIRASADVYLKAENTDVRDLEETVPAIALIYRLLKSDAVPEENEKNAQLLERIHSRTLFEQMDKLETLISQKYLKEEKARMLFSYQKQLEVLETTMRQAGWNTGRIRQYSSGLALYEPFGGFLNDDGSVRDFNRVDWPVFTEQHAELRNVDELKALLIQPAQSHLDSLSRGDTFGAAGPDLFLVLGNPDFKGMLEFVKTWKAYEAAGYKIPVVIAGGRGTVPLIDNVLAHYGDALPQPVREWLVAGRADDAFYESAVLQRIFTEVEGIDENFVRVEEQPSKRSIENFTFSAPVVRNWTAELGLKNPEIAIVTSPPLLRRIGWVAKKGWENDVAKDGTSDGWRIRRFKAYDINLSELDDQQLVDLVGYVAGYPDSYGKLYPALGSWSEGYSEIEGIDYLQFADALTQLDWTELALVRSRYQDFLDAHQVTYDESTNRLVLNKSELRSALVTTPAVRRHAMREFTNNSAFVRLLNTSSENWPNTAEARRDLEAGLLVLNELGQARLDGITEEAYGEHLARLRQEMIERFDVLHTGDDETFVERIDVINHNLNPIKREVMRDMETGFLAMDEKGEVYAAGVTSAEYEDFLVTRRGFIIENFPEAVEARRDFAAARLEELHNQDYGFSMIRLDKEGRDSGEFSLRQKMIIRMGPFQLIFEPDGEEVHYTVRDVRDGSTKPAKNFTLNETIMIGSYSDHISLNDADIDPVMLFLQIDSEPAGGFSVNARHVGSNWWMHTEILHQTGDSSIERAVPAEPFVLDEDTAVPLTADLVTRSEYRSSETAAWVFSVITGEMTSGVALRHWGPEQVEKIVRSVLEAQRLGVLSGVVQFGERLTQRLNGLRSFLPADKNENPRHLVDHRLWNDMLDQDLEDFLAILIYLTRHPEVGYTLLVETSLPAADISSMLRERLKAYEPQLGMDIDDLFALENLEIRTAAGQNQAALEIYGISAQAKQAGRVTALVSAEENILSRLNNADKRRYRLLKIKADDPSVQSEISVAAAELLDEFTEDMLNQSDQALMNQVVQTLNRVVEDMRLLGEFLRAA